MRSVVLPRVHVSRSFTIKSGWIGSVCYPACRQRQSSHSRNDYRYHFLLLYFCEKCGCSGYRTLCLTVTSAGAEVFFTGTITILYSPNFQG